VKKVDFSVAPFGGKKIGSEIHDPEKEVVCKKKLFLKSLVLEVGGVGKIKEKYEVIVERLENTRKLLRRGGYKEITICELWEIPKVYIKKHVLLNKKKSKKKNEIPAR
jgi:hypothetical protein